MMRFNFFKKQKEEPVKVLELFGGIGACTQAFKRVGIPFEVVDYVEIDKYACKSYNAMNGTDFKPQDICEWDKDIKVDFIMHGSPCQDFSVAGKGLGGDEGSGTRSSLMYETIRIVEKLKPKYVLWENVKNVTGKKHRHNFDKYLVSLQQLGYNNYWQIMNAKDYGIPQNRERVFVLSIRRDIDNGYEFPEPFPLQLRLKDMLDADVDESFYISDERTKSLQRDLINKDTLMLDVCQYKREGHPREYNEVSPTLSARDYKDPRLIQVGNLDIKGQDIVKRVYSSDGLSPTLTNMQGGNRQPKVVAREATKKGYAEAEVGDSVERGEEDEMRIRKLTPKECWRLQGFADEDFHKAEAVNSNTQLYKQAGNSIVVNCIEEILINLFKKG